MSAFGSTFGVSSSAAIGAEPAHKKTFAARAPVGTDDSSGGYDVWSYWVDTSGTRAEIYRCMDATVGAAVWVHTSLDLDDLGNAATKNVGTAAGDVAAGDDGRLHAQNTDTGTNQASFQIGTSGPRWKNETGTLAARNADDDADADVRVASLEIGGVVDTVNIEYPVVEIKDDNDAVVAKVTVEFDDLGAGTQNGVMKFYVARAGTLTEVLELDGGA